jgi:hypothetical protein
MLPDIGRSNDKDYPRQGEDIVRAAAPIARTRRSPMKRLVLALTLALLSAGPSLAGCYEGIGCTDGDRFRTSDLRQYSCPILWELRNSIYKENGYCFKTERAKSYFGNRGCWVNDQNSVKLNAIERYNVRQIVAVEAQKGC